MEEPVNNDTLCVTDPLAEDNTVASIELTLQEPSVQEQISENLVVAKGDEPMVVDISQNAANIETAESKEIEISDAEPSQLAVTKVLSATQIEEMFDFTTDNSKVDHEISLDPDDEPFDLNPQVNIEDMKAAQDELKDFDILVCGSCHTVVHFVEEFLKHKPVCKKKSDFHGTIAETKPQVWAFLLWKNARSKMNKQGVSIEESSWKLYQKWCKMPERIRNAWVAAGQTVMNFSTFGYSKPDTLIKPLPPKRVLEKDTTVDLYDGEEGKPVVIKRLVQRDSSGEIKEIKPIRPTGRKRLNEDIENIRNQLEDGDSMDKTPEKELPRVGFTKIHRVKNKDGGEDTLQEEEFVVEKIVSRRFNPRKKQYEYLLKWEGYPSDQNTWEPAENLEACQHLLKAFEESLAKQSLTKPKPRKQVEPPSAGSSATFAHSGRPIRYSKQKALNQVKAWCGSIKPDDAEVEMLKRKGPVDDSDEDEDPFIKKLKLEKETDSEDSTSGRVFYSKTGKSGIIRRPGRPPLKPKITNGTADSLAAVLGLESSGDEGKSNSALDVINKGIVKKSTGISPHNQQVLVANAKGVVKVDPSQVPNLSSGVYIMSNKSGIIKLDSVTPSKAMSLKGATPSTVKQLTVSSQQSTHSSVLTTTTTPTISQSSSHSGLIMVNRESTGLGLGGARSGVMRKPGVTGRGGSTRGVGRPRLNPSVRVQNPNTRLIHSGPRSNIAITPSIRPKLPITANRPAITEHRRGLDLGERRVLGPKLGRGGRGGFRGRGGATHAATSHSTPTFVPSDSERGCKGVDAENVFFDLPQESSSDSDAGLTDLFPTDLPPLEPESPPRPLSLCPETGKVLLKAEGEKTPEPTPPQSPKEATVTVTLSDKEKSKGESGSNGQVSFFNKVSNNNEKEALIKKTLKPGSIGSVSVSPKKSFPEDSDSDDIVTITGDDGVVYKVRKSELNSTLLVSGEDGQQCVYVTAGEENEDGTTVLTLDSYSDSVTQLGQEVNILGGEEGGEGEGEGETQFYLKEGEEGQLVSLQVEGGDGDEGPSQVVAQLVEAGQPQPGGGPRRVVLLLPDGNLMMTEVDEEQYAALELDKFQGSSGGPTTGEIE